jgi:hypothetical protein
MHHYRRVSENPNHSAQQTLSVYATSVVSWTHDCTGLDVKISNSELMDAVSADMARQRLMVFRRRLFVSLAFLVFRLLPNAAFRLRPRPRNFCIRFCVDAVTCLEYIRQGIYFRLYPSKCYLQRVMPLARHLWHHSKA